MASYKFIIAVLLLTFTLTNALKECDDMCSQQAYNPVCATNRNGEIVIFSNPCYFVCTVFRAPDFGFRWLPNEQCGLPPVPKTFLQQKEECPVTCTLEFEPVCGQDQTGNLQTFDNMCQLKSVQCQDRAAGWKLLKQGQCSDSQGVRNRRDIRGEDVPTYCPVVCPLRTYPMCYRSC